MNENLQVLRERLLQNKEILVVLSPHFDNECLIAASSLFSTLKQIADEGPVFNVVDFLITAPLSDTQKSLVGGGVVKYVKNTLDPRNYIISIPKDGKVDKVKWREENESFKLFLTPAYGDLSIEDVNFEQIGSSYKYVILVGFDKLSDLGDVYDKNKSFFDRAPKAVLTDKGNLVKENLLIIPKEGSYTDIVYDFLKTLNVRLNQDIAQLLLNGYVESINGSLSNITDRLVLDRIGELMEFGAQLNQVGGETSKKDTYTQLQLRQRVYSNIKQDSAGILWSVVTSSELKDLQIEDPEVDVRESIPFNSYQGYDNAFVLYELGDGTIWGKVETEDLDLPKLLQEFEMTVASDGLVIRSDKAVEYVESRVLDLLGAQDQDFEEEYAQESPVTPKTDVSLLDAESGSRSLMSGQVDDELEKDLSMQQVESDASEDDGENSIPILSTGSGKMGKEVSSGEEAGTGLIKPAIEDDEESFSDDPIIGGEDDSFGPPKIFNSGSFSGPFSGMKKKNK